MLWGSLCATRVESWGAGGKGGSGTGWNMPVADHCITEVGFVQFNLHFLRDFPSLWGLFQSKAGEGALLWWRDMVTMSLMNARLPWTRRQLLWNANPDTLIMFHLVSLPSASHSSSFKHPNDISLARILSLHSSIAVRVCCWLGHWADPRKGGSLSLAEASSSPWPQHAGQTPVWPVCRTLPQRQWTFIWDQITEMVFWITWVIKKEWVSEKVLTGSEGKPVKTVLENFSQSEE